VRQGQELRVGEQVQRVVAQGLPLGAKEQVVLMAEQALQRAAQLA
jgi:hypothetical protein